MGQRQGDGDIGCPLMQRKQVDVAVRPALHRTVAQRDEHSQQQVDGRGANRSQSQIRAEVQQTDGQNQANLREHALSYCVG